MSSRRLRFARTLRVRIMLLLLLAMIPPVLLMIHSADQQRRAEASEAEMAALHMARLAASDHERFTEGAHQFLGALAELQPVRRHDGAACAPIFADLLQQYPLYTNLLAIDLTGKPYCSAAPINPATNMSGRAWFQRSIAQNGFSMGGYEVEPGQNGARLTFAHAILDDSGRITGAVSATMSTDWLEKLVSTEETPAGSTLAVLDPEGTVLVRYPEPWRWVGKSLSESVAVKSLLQSGVEGATEGPAGDGSPYLYAFTPLRDPPGGRQLYLLISIPAEVAYGPANRQLVRNLIGVALTVLMTGVAVWAGARVFIMRDVNAVVRAANRLTTGDLAARTGLPDTGGEIAQIGYAFDEMAEALQRREVERQHAAAEIRTLNEELEQRVQARTQELAVANSALRDENAERRRVEEALRRYADENARLYELEREAYRQLEQTMHQLIQAEKLAALGRLAAALAHEINNPLQAMKGHLELALDERLDAERREEHLHITGENIDRLAEITRRVLSFARPDGGPRALVSVNEVVQRTLALAQQRMNQAHIRLELDLQPVPLAWAVAEQLSQVFLNIIINAVEAMSDGGCLLVASAATDDAITIRFANDGPSLPPEHLARLFEPFFTTKPDGTGLGLSTSASLIRQHGGRLEAQNRPGGRGVEFMVVLPAGGEPPISHAEEEAAQ